MRRLLHAGMSRNSVETLSCWRVRWQGGWVGRMDEACGICRDANRMALSSRAPPEDGKVVQETHP